VCGGEGVGGDVVVVIVVAVMVVIVVAVIAVVMVLDVMSRTAWWGFPVCGVASCFVACVVFL
jgi:hypothetical protein